MNKIQDRKCLGIFYRCRVEYYRNKKGVFIQSFKMMPLRSYSCQGKCNSRTDTAYLCDEEWLEECLSNSDLDDEITMPHMPENGGLYQLKCIMDGAEDWKWEFVLMGKEDYARRRKDVEGE